MIGRLMGNMFAVPDFDDEAEHPSNSSYEKDNLSVALQSLLQPPHIEAVVNDWRFYKATSGDFETKMIELDVFF